MDGHNDLYPYTILFLHKGRIPFVCTVVKYVNCPTITLYRFILELIIFVVKSVAMYATLENGLDNG